MRSCEAQGRGVLAIATGGGKTRTALIASVEAQRPARLAQCSSSYWCLRGRSCSNGRTTSGTSGSIRSSRAPPTALNVGSNFRRLRLPLGVGNPRTEVVVVTNNLFAQDDDIARTPGPPRLAEVQSIPHWRRDAQSRGAQGLSGFAGTRGSCGSDSLPRPSGNTIQMAPTSSSSTSVHLSSSSDSPTRSAQAA